MTDPLHVSDVLARPPKPSVMAWRAVRLRCPRCATGHLFHGWFHMVERCPGCGYQFKRDEGFFLGAFTLNLIVTLASMFLVLLWLVFREAAHPSGPLVAPIVAGVLCATALPIAFYPVSFTLWAAFDLSSAPLELREIVEAVDAAESLDDRPEEDGPSPGEPEDTR